MALGDNHNMYDVRIPLFWNKTQDITNIDKVTYMYIDLAYY
jgi:hypothetical protein